MKLYNSLTRKVEKFTPLKAKHVSLYSCGPTVYDHIHIGNLSSFIAADTLRRALAVSGLRVQHVMNITDINDKIIARSQEVYQDEAPEVAMEKLAKQYEDIFMHDMEAIGNDVSAMSFVRATDYFKQMQEIISKLYKAGVAYITDDGVYFSIEKYRKSGKTYGQLIEITEASTSNARIDNDEYDKDSVHDFALWKIRKEGEPAWDFELDGHNLLGRPGWHIECSAMSETTLGVPFDIHTGGIDLKFPHHENEIAQSTGASPNDTFAKYFIHNEHLLVDGKKMSKSLNNFFTLEDIIAKGFDPLAFRLLVLQSHYRSQSNFSWENLEAAQNRLNYLRAWADLRHQPSIPEMSEELNTLWRETLDGLLEAMSNDLDTPGALACLAKLVNWMMSHPTPSRDGKHSDGALAMIDSLFGLNLDGRPDIKPDQKKLLSERQKARDKKDWPHADELRMQLEEEKLGVRDTEYGQIWYRI
jgi:cysteinyl-tRNA synthetase